MRKALITVAVATALFAVGAFAASFTVNSEDIASGANAVEACASNVEITFDDVAVPADSTSDWTVSEATATFLDGTATTDACTGFTANLALTIDGAVLEFAADGLVDGSTETFDLGTQNVGAITNATVAVEGSFLPLPAVIAP